MPRIPPDQCSPHGTVAATKRDNPPAETANPHQRQDDRASGDDDSAAKLAVRRSRLVQSGFPVYVRYNDLAAAGIVANWTQLRRLIDTQDFPAGVMIGRNTRVWHVDQIKQWLAARPSARKVIPPNARHPRGRKPAACEQARVALGAASPQDVTSCCTPSAGPRTKSRTGSKRRHTGTCASDQ